MQSKPAYMWNSITGDGCGDQGYICHRSLLIVLQATTDGYKLVLGIDKCGMLN